MPRLRPPRKDDHSRAVRPWGASAWHSLRRRVAPGVVAFARGASVCAAWLGTAAPPLSSTQHRWPQFPRSLAVMVGLSCALLLWLRPCLCDCSDHRFAPRCAWITASPFAFVLELQRRPSQLCLNCRVVLCSCPWITAPSSHLARWIVAAVAPLLVAVWPAPFANLLAPSLVVVFAAPPSPQSGRCLRSPCGLFRRRAARRRAPRAKPT